MSDTDAMVRLMEHTADVLDAALETAQQHSTNSWTIAEQVVFTDLVAAMALAQGVLLMVAASVAPEGRSIAGRLTSDYSAWAEANDETNMSDGELAAIARFITSGGAS